ncbi:MAG TPA: (Fe-S)-binding protein [Thermodesulfobacteriota bacterium]|nr:(Fe-S)-binding protein [Deltaproteobacteria bacterium]HNR12257.1 (Fe-S)-binding protein [Thermodesulfobacteriota bacterium]HNU72285.1 (Fe-S)-binding protein [Thermodesulfobacteriota bacterium]HOC39713.1 (Fe-S)-binding protein [Thermodesulfobacteriota bacterium]
MEGKPNHNLTIESVDSLASEAAACVKCGRCLSVCPIYRETGREPQTARGKIALIEAAASGSLSEANINDILSCCLLCGACTEICPNMVPAYELIRKARTIFTSRRNSALAYKTFLSRILPFPQRLDRLYQAGKALEPLLLKKVPLESGLYYRLPRGREKSARIIPALAQQSFLDVRRKRSQPHHPGALLFIGCVANYILPGIAEAALALLEHLGIPVVIPPEQSCCGLMASGAGEIEAARQIARRTIDAFAGEESVPIVAFCSSCSAHLKQYPALFEDKSSRQKALAFSQRVKDLSELLVDAGLPAMKNFQAEEQVRFTFHDPCHLRRAQGIIMQPRELLRAIRGAEFVETGQENLCCGSGGSFDVSHYDLSLQIFRRRVRSIEEAGIDTVVTSCMGCLMQFQDGFHAMNKQQAVKHLAEVLKQALVE